MFTVATEVPHSGTVYHAIQGTVWIRFSSLIPSLEVPKVNNRLNRIITVGLWRKSESVTTEVKVIEQYGFLFVVHRLLCSTM